MRKVILILLLGVMVMSIVSFASSTGVSEAPQPQWSRTYPRSVNYSVKGYSVSVGGDEGLSVAQTSDRGFAIVADINDHHYEPHTGGVDNHTTLVIRTDSLGNAAWKKGYLLSYPRAIFQTEDSGFAIGGNSFILKLDAEGNEQWSKNFSSYFFTAIQASDGGYVLAGMTDVYPFYDIANIIKIGVDGNLLWNKTYRESPSWSRACAIVETEEGDFAVAGEQGGAWFGVIDSKGNLKVSQKYSELEGTFSSIVGTEDGGFVLVGGNQIGGINIPSQGIIAEVDSQGRMLWNRTYNNPPNVGFWFSSVAQTGDGGYIAVGYSSALFKTNAFGDLQWYFSSSTDVSDVLGATNSVIATEGGGFAVVGSKKDGIWFAKFASESGSSPNESSLLAPLIIAVLVLAIVVVVETALLVYFKKRKR